MRHLRVAALLQLALLFSGAATALGQDMASSSNTPPAEHVRHLRSRKAAKPILFTDEDKTEASTGVDPTSTGAAPAKTAAAEKPREAAPHQKKVAAARPAPAKPAPARQAAVAHKNTPRPEPAASAAAPVSRGFLEDIFGDN